MEPILILLECLFAITALYLGMCLFDVFQNGNPINWLIVAMYLLPLVVCLFFVYTIPQASRGDGGNHTLI